MLVYIRVKLKPPVRPPEPTPRKVPPTAKGKRPVSVPNPPNVPIPEPTLAVRSVEATSLGDACVKGEAMGDVLAVIETSLEPLT